jgi:segregation and condensation protein A
MENPTFKLEGILKSDGGTEDFVGPLTLILQLLSRDKIEIRDIKVSRILEQYLDYLDEMHGMDLEISSEFVVMASHLLLIKTKTLLAAGEEIDELSQLISSLEELKHRGSFIRIMNVTDKLAEMYRVGGGYIKKPPEFLPPEKGYKYTHDKSDLHAAIKQVLSRSELMSREVDLEEMSIPKRAVYSVTEKAAEVVEIVRASGTVLVDSLFSKSENNIETIAIFVAVLELCKLGHIMLGKRSGDVVVSYTAGHGGEIDLSEMGEF